MKKILLLLVALLALLAVGGIAFVGLNTTTDNDAPIRIYLPTDAGALAARDTLVANGLVDDGPLFLLMAKAFKLDGWKSGSYVVEPHTTLYRLIKRITRGQQDPLRLTIGKFRTPQQLNEYLNTKLMHNDFNIPLDSFHLVLQDTYEFFWTVTPEQFMQRMRKEYDRFWMEEIGANGEYRFELLSMSDFIPDIQLATIIIASIVEEETNYAPEKKLIANVYWNRLDNGIPLQADPTVKYAVGDFTLKRILNKHLAVESPFNTYLHAGLPPAPICLPSKATIDSVINGEDLESGYLYFCASDKMDGTHRFAATLAEHNRNAAAFHKAINKLGIK